jgi:hypothetical protein
LSGLDAEDLSLVDLAGAASASTHEPKHQGVSLLTKEPPQVTDAKRVVIFKM